MKNLPLFFTILPLVIMIFHIYSGQDNENSFRIFVENHVKIIEPKLKAMNVAYWNAAATGEEKYYKEQAELELEVRTIYSNKEEFEQLKKWKEAGNIKDPLLQRQLILLYNSYLVNQYDTVLLRKITEKSAEVQQKFNTFRPVLEGKEVTDNEIDEILKTETNSDKRKKAWEASKEVGKLVANDVIELVKLRNEGARKLGFKNFYEMSLIASEQTMDEITSIFDELKKLSDEPFKKIKDEIDSKLSKKYGIKPEEMMPWHYQDRFFQEPPAIGNVDIDKYFKGKNIEKIAEKFYREIGLPVEKILSNSDLYPRKGKYQHAFCIDIDRKGDVRTMQNLTDNKRWMGTMLHELGHAIYSINIDSNLPFLLRQESHIFTTEAIAMMMERQVDNADWLQKMVGLSNEDKAIVNVECRESLRMKALIFCRWSQVMMRFEKALYENPDQDLNKLWWQLVKEYQLVNPPPRRNEPDWASKIHISQSPAYYHNYQLGELMASQLQYYIGKNILKLQNTKEVCFAGEPQVGKYLRENIFHPGALYRWDELIKQATGEKLTAKYFINEYVQ